MPMLAEPLPVEEPDDDSPPDDLYLHLILDEAQDLWPMECRMIDRGGGLWGGLPVQVGRNQTDVPIAHGAQDA